MAPAIAMVTAVAGAGAAVATLAGAIGTAGWFLAGFGKIACPACDKKIPAREFYDHARNHAVDCPSCGQGVPFQLMEEHAKTHHVSKHSYACPLCKQPIALADMETHFKIHEYCLFSLIWPSRSELQFLMSSLNVRLTLQGRGG
jgi:hypothetical protein